MRLQITDFSALKKDAEAIFGGKSHGLARLILAQAKVPEGFAVAATTLPPDQWHEKDREVYLSKFGFSRHIFCVISFFVEKYFRN
ncbi:MAG: hypothetical protein B6245_14530 [Desulfobacteraceae bacterium 4572_88]|nr:MAG: hypothetical protein B6245_14530 [Desulfobacteraceae bacterium 4572_88]